MTVPGERHKDVGDEQETDRFEHVPTADALQGDDCTIRLTCQFCRVGRSLLLPERGYPTGTVAGGTVTAGG